MTLSTILKIIITTATFTASLIGILNFANNKNKKILIWIISILASMYVLDAVLSNYKSSCTFDCSNIDSLKNVIQNEKSVQNNAIDNLKSNLNNLKNEDSVHDIVRQIDSIKYGKVEVYEIMEISLDELNKNCDGCKTSKGQFDSIVNKFNLTK